MPRRITLSLLAAAAALTLTQAASATVLSFDDLSGDGAVPANYGGLDWSAGGWSVYAAAQDPYNAHSGNMRATAAFGATDADTTIRFTAPAMFQGAWFAGLAGATVTFELFLGGTQVGASATLDPGATPTFLASGYAGAVDAVVVSSPWQASYVMDDFTFAAVPAVPEPGTWALTFAGLGVVGLVSRRRARR